MSMWEHATKTLFNMLRTRQHQLPEQLPDLTELAGDKKKDLSFGVTHPRKLVYLSNEKKVGIRTIRLLLACMEEGQYQAALCVFVSQPTPFAKRELVALQQETPSRWVELFYTSELRIDITQHQLVPRHVQLSTQEAEAVLKQYKASHQHIPKILLTDPMARYLGLREGEMVRVERKMGNQGQLPMYRIAASPS